MASHNAEQGAEGEAFRPALIVVDMQEDFCPPNGALAVPSGRSISAPINSLLTLPFVLKLGTKDWHPASHISFASNHPPPHNQPFTSTTVVRNPHNPAQTEEIRLWPVHCVQGTPGAELIPELEVGRLDGVVRKGMEAGVEMYSAFGDAFGNANTSGAEPEGEEGKGGEGEGIEARLRRAQVSHVYVVGLAMDYCVLWTAVDAAKAGFKTVVVEEATRAVDAGEEGVGRARTKWKEMGVGVVSLEGKEVERVRRRISVGS